MRYDLTLLLKIAYEAALVLTYQQFGSLLIFNFTTMSPKILANISKFILIIAEFIENKSIDNKYETAFIRIFQICCIFSRTPGN